MIELNREQKQVLWRAVAAIALSLICLWLTRTILPKWWEFPETSAEKLVFAVQLNVFIFVWVMIAVRM